MTEMKVIIIITMWFVGIMGVTIMKKMGNDYIGYAIYALVILTMFTIYSFVC